MTGTTAVDAHDYGQLEPPMRSAASTGSGPSHCAPWTSGCGPTASCGRRAWMRSSSTWTPWQKTSANRGFDQTWIEEMTR